MADNVQIVLNAFETLFNKRNYAVAERFWSPNYNKIPRRKQRGIQKSANCRSSWSFR